MPVISYNINSAGQGGVSPKIIYIFTDDPIAKVVELGYIDWLANGQGLNTGDVATVTTLETPTSILGVGFYELVRVPRTPHWLLVPESGGGGGQVITWSTVTTNTQMVIQSGYIANGSIVFTLPATAAIGDQVIVLGRGASWSIHQNAGQKIYFGNVSTTLGVGGSLSSTDSHDNISLICQVANTSWSVFPPPQGNITVI